MCPTPRMVERGCPGRLVCLAVPTAVELLLWVHGHPTGVIADEIYGDTSSGPDALWVVPRPRAVQLRGLSVRLRLDRRLLQLHHPHRHVHVQQRAGVQRLRLLRLRQVRLHPARLLRRHLREVSHVPGCLHHQKVREGREVGRGRTPSGSRRRCWQELSPAASWLGWDCGDFCSLGLESVTVSPGRTWRSSQYLPPLPQGVRGVQEV